VAEVVISAQPTPLADLVAVARGARVALGSDAIATIEASRRVVDAALQGDEPVYGLNTLIGHARDQRVPVEAIRAFQPQLVAMHAGGMGDPLPPFVVRAGMAARLVGIARGGSGASLGLAQALASLLNAGITPRVPSTASVGAGDLSQHAAVGLALLGIGVVEVGEQVVPAPQALQDAGLVPVELEPKDGLAIISANGFAIGYAALVLERIGRVLDAADTVAAVTMDASHANASIVDPAAMSAKGIAGQTVSGARIRERLSGTSRAAASVQDPLTIRVIPQVHGAAREVVGFAAQAVETELNAAADNPLSSIEAGRLISNGNFHPMLLALAVDAIRPAVAHVGQLSERRSDRLWNRLVAQLSQGEVPVLADPAVRAALGLRYPIAARATRLRQLADPVTLDVGSLDLGQEDHATNAPEAVFRTAEAIDVLVDVLTVELLLSRATLQMAPEPAPAPGTRAAIAALDATLAESGVSDPAAIQRALAQAVSNGRLG
jgi:histidine ammonia-lyase